MQPLTLIALHLLKYPAHIVVMFKPFPLEIIVQKVYSLQGFNLSVKYDQAVLLRDLTASFS